MCGAAYAFFEKVRAKSEVSSVVRARSDGIEEAVAAIMRRNEEETIVSPGRRASKVTGL